MNQVRTVSDLQRKLENFTHAPSHTVAVVLEYFSALDTPRSLAAWLLYSSNEHVQLLDLDIDPLDYLQSDIDGFRRDYCATVFLSKSDFLKTGYDKKERALSKFRLAELQCRETNSRILNHRRDPIKSPYCSLLLAMSRKIDLVLGEFSSSEFTENASWGPGVSTSLKGSDVGAERKFQSETGVTRELYPLLNAHLHAFSPLWVDREPETDSSLRQEVGNTVTTVPKNSKIDRVIAVEPGLNLFFQKSLGKMIRTRLRAFGVDLRHQTRNQLLSKLGSSTGHLATVDFSSASDTIAKRLVEEVLPPKWLSVLDILRSKFGKISETEVIKWEKFSSMGNGFTFELESLIFLCAALSCCDAVGVDSQDVSVYGDDVIIPVAAYDLYAEFCTFLGFSINHQKSFSSGVFRESCGAHYFAGSDVKPIYLRKALIDARSSFKLANSVRDLSHRSNSYYGCDRRLLPVWRRIQSGVPTALRSLKIPYGYGDGGFSSNFDEACPSLAPDGHEGFIASCVIESPVRIESNFRGVLCARLHSLEQKYASIRGRSNSFSRIGSDLAPGNFRTLRGQVKVRVSRIFIPSRWYDYGPWV